MRIEYLLNKVDFLEYQLFAASNSEIIIKNRKNSRIRLPIVYFILGLLLFLFADLIFALVFIGLGVAWYILHPYFMKKRYQRHFANHVEENYHNRFGKVVSLDFEEEFIIVKDFLGESKLRIKEITEINETKSYIFIKLSSGESLIIPKNSISNLNELNRILTKIASDFDIIQNICLDWEWK
ncbi:YcxB family protein [Geofilum rhodophaeum]|uniref:YcxB family protein n=1 Tax=Geofilum rhodophaeum TaxID=1965019 RepID=UPI000B51E677|nr:YcxB family protein [Geofilum rhodophaeum]